MPSFFEMLKANLAKTLGSRDSGLTSKRFKLRRPSAPVEAIGPRGKLVKQRELQKKVSLDHKFYGTGEEENKRAMEIAKLKIMRENIIRQANDSDYKGVRRSNREEFSTSPCEHVF